VSTLLGSRSTSQLDDSVRTDLAFVMYSNSHDLARVEISRALVFGTLATLASFRLRGVPPSIARSMVNKSFGLSCTCEQYRTVRASALIPTDLRATEAAARANRKGEKLASSVIPRGRFSLTNNTRPPPGITQHAIVGPSRWTRWHSSNRCNFGLALWLAFNKAIKWTSWRSLPCHRIGGRSCGSRVPSSFTTQRGPPNLCYTSLQWKPPRGPVFNIWRSCRYRKQSQ
jgi:hypothetical protein